MQCNIVDNRVKQCKAICGRFRYDLESGIPMQSYILFYRILDDGIEIMRVVRGDRDIEAIFDESSL